MVFARSLHLFATMLALLTASPVFAAPTDTPPDPNSLAAQIMRTPIDAGQCAIAVGAEHTTLKQNPGPTIPVANMSDLAFRYGEIAREFGDVIAVAPPTMTVLNTDFGVPDIYAGMPVEDALKLLCASLTDSQWALLTGKSGLGMGDLTSDDQKSLFEAILGPGSLKVKPPSGDTLDLTAEKPLARLRLAAKTRIWPMSLDNQAGAVSAMLAQEKLEGPKYQVWPPFRPDSDTVYGQETKAEFPNILKRSGLDYANAALQAAIPLNDLKTVSDLVYRIGRATKIELYVDPHYGSQSLTVVAAPAKGKPDSPPSAKASDLLKALALCVTGTYRQVGPAFALTDDIMGVSTRMQMIQDLKDRANSLRKKPIDAATAALASHHALADLHSFTGADLSPTAAEHEPASQTRPNLDPNLGVMLLKFSNLDSAQQTMLREEQAEVAKEPGSAPPPPLDTAETAMMTTPDLQLLSPSVVGPISLQIMPMIQFFYVPSAAKPAQKPASAKPATPKPPSQTLAQVLAAIPRRAVQLNLKTPAEVDSAIAAMRKIGLNALWLPVLQDGKARVPGTALSDPADKTDLLAHAVAAAKGTDIAIFPVLDLLEWGPDSSGDLQDLTVRGENSAQTAARTARLAADRAGSDSAAALSTDKALAVSPFSSVVRDSLLSVVRKVSATSGIGGVVWRDSALPGYAGETYGRDQFGYTLPARVAFLRAYHADPVDINDLEDSLPIWDRGKGVPESEWLDFRAGADRALLSGLWNISDASDSRPVLIQQTGQVFSADWYGSWDNLKAPLPAYHLPGTSGSDGAAYPYEPAKQAKLESHIAILSVAASPSIKPQDLATLLAGKMKDGWDGFVMKFSGSQAEGLEGLERLGKELSP